jgi:hypothetical protein
MARKIWAIKRGDWIAEKWVDLEKFERLWDDFVLEERTEIKENEKGGKEFFVKMHDGTWVKFEAVEMM